MMKMFAPLLKLYGRLLKLKSLLGHEPFDTSTEEGRSNERYRRIALSTLAAVTAKGVLMLATFISIPMTVSYLGTERFGLWMTISSFSLILSFVDLGIGVSLLNVISEAIGKNEIERIQKSVSSAFFLLVAEAILVTLAFFTLYALIDWRKLFDLTTPQAIAEVGPSIAVFIVTFAVNLPISLVQRVQDGFQEGFYNHIWQIVGAVASLIALFLAIGMQAGLPWLVVALVGTPAAAMALNFMIQFWFKRPWNRPKMSWVEPARTIALFKTGTMFLVLNLFTVIGLYSTDNLIISYIQGASAVSTYAVVQKMYSVSYLLWMFLFPLWPAYGESIARKDFEWVRRSLRYSLLITLIGGFILAVVLFFCGRWIIEVWVGKDLIPDHILLAGFSLDVMVAGFRGSMSSLLNSSFLLKKQLIFYGISSMVSFALKALLCFHMGPSGVIWGSVIAYTFLYVVPSVLLVRRSFWSKESLTMAG